MAGPRRLRHDAGSGTDLLRTPPHSVEAEQAVLGGLLLDTAAWDQVGDSVRADDFYRPDHRLIFEAIAELVGAVQGPATWSPCREQLERNGKLQDAGGLAYLGTLARDTPTAANVRAYAQIVRERSLLRQLVSAGSDIAGVGVQRRRRDRARPGRPGRAAWSSRSPSSGTRRARGRAVGAHAAAGADRQDRRVALQPGQAARPAHGLHRFRQQDRRPARRRPGHRGRAAVDGQDHARHQHGRERGAGPDVQRLGG